MSLRTHSALFLIVFAALVGGRAVPVRADSDPQAHLNQSMNDYYNALKNNPDKSKGAIHRLKQQYVDPASKEFVEKSRKKAGENYGDYLQAHDPRHPSGASDLKEPASADSGGYDIRNQPRNFVMAPEPEPAQTLDGSDIPRELEFPGAPKTPMPPPSPRPKPAVLHKYR